MPPGAAAMLAAWTDHQPRPVLSKQLPLLTETDAYAIQTAVNRKRLAGDRPAGFKAGLTAAAGQQRFGVSAPVAGVLWPEAELPVIAGMARISRDGLHNPMLETELGFVVAQRIARPLSDIAAVKARVQWVLPVLELPDLSFDDPAALRGPDIIAANVAARYYLRGRALRPAQVALNEVAVSLYRDGERIGGAPAGTVMGDQWQALLWLINRTIANGWVIEPGQLLITGAIGQMQPLLHGRYTADFGALGQLVLDVE